MKKDFKCSVCGKMYAQSYYRDIHEVRCKERRLANEQTNKR